MGDGAVDSVLIGVQILSGALRGGAAPFKVVGVSRDGGWGPEEPMGRGGQSLYWV